MTEFKTKLGHIGCHTVNLGEIFQQVDNQVIVVEENKIKIPLDKLPLLGGMIWSKLQESFLECEGKELVIDFGDTKSADMAENFLKFLLGFLPGQSKPATNE